MRRSVALVGLLGILLAGCGGDEGSISAKGDKPTTTASEDGGSGGGGGDDDVDAIVEALSDAEFGIGSDEARCAAEAMVAEVSPEGIRIVTSPDGSPSDLDPDDATAVRSALNECVDPDVFGAAIVEGFSSAGPFSLTEEETTCAARALGDEIGGAGDFLFASEDLVGDEGTALILDAVGGCITTESLVSGLGGAFAADGSMDPAMGTCVAEALVSQFGGTELLQAFAASADGSLPADLQSGIEQAALGCAPAG